MKTTLIFCILLIHSAILFGQDNRLRITHHRHEPMGNPTVLASPQDVLTEELCINFTFEGVGEDDVYGFLGDGKLVVDNTNNYYTITATSREKNSDTGLLEPAYKAVFFSSVPKVDYEKADSIFEYAYESDLNQYFLDFKEINHFDANGHLVSSIDYSDGEITNNYWIVYDGNTLVYSVLDNGSSRDSTVYDFAPSYGDWTGTQYRLGMDSLYRPVVKTYYFGNTDGQLDSLVDASYNESASDWFIDSRSYFDYDNNGNMILDFSERVVAVGWVPDSRDSFYYDLGNVIYSRYVSQDYKNGEWVTIELTDGHTCMPSASEFVAPLSFSATMVGDDLVFQDKHEWGSVDVLISNFSGAKWLERNYATLPEKINLSSLPAGLYWVQLRQGGRAGVAKFVKF